MTVEWFVDGTSRGTTTVSSAGTTSFTPDSVSAGEHSWHVELTDSYGETSTSSTATFVTPSTLQIYNESAPSELLDNTTATLRYLYQDQNADGDSLVLTRNVSDGKINMTGLPANEPFVLSVDAPGYLPRRIYVPSLVELQRVYLLPESKKHVSVSFDLTDYTGRFQESETVLVIKRPLNESWQRVQADYFGATGTVDAQLRYNVRHRLYLVNTETGRDRFLGSYTPLADGIEPIQVSTNGTILIRNSVFVNVDPSVRTLSSSDQTNLSVTVDNQSIALDSWSADVQFVPDSGATQTLASASKSGPSGGTFSPTVNLTDRGGGQVRVVVSYTVDGVTMYQNETYYVQQSYGGNEFSLLSILGSGIEERIPAQNLGQFQTMAAVLLTALLTIFAAYQFPLSTEGVGVITLGSVAFFGIIGWVPYTMVFSGVVAWGAFVGIRRGL